MREDTFTAACLHGAQILVHEALHIPSLQGAREPVKAADANRSSIQSLKGERDRFIPVPFVLQNAKGNNGPGREVSSARNILSGF